MARAQDIWENRIVGYGEIDPSEAVANEHNWRTHPRVQEETLDGLLTDVGIVQNIIINKRSSEAWPADQRGIETMVDGHLRVALAAHKGQRQLPVTYVDLSPAEEAEVLATLDPIGALAKADRARQAEVLDYIETDNAAILDLLDDGRGKDPDRQLEEIDADALPVRPVWCLCTFPTEMLPQMQPILDEMESLGVRVEVSNE